MDWTEWLTVIAIIVGIPVLFHAEIIMLVEVIQERRRRRRQ